MLGLRMSWAKSCSLKFNVCRLQYSFYFKPLLLIYFITRWESQTPSPLQVTSNLRFPKQYPIHRPLFPFFVNRPKANLACRPPRSCGRPSRHGTTRIAISGPPILCSLPISCLACCSQFQALLADPKKAAEGKAPARPSRPQAPTRQQPTPRA